MPETLNIWCNAQFPEPAWRELRKGLGRHHLNLAQSASASNLVPTGPDPMLARADIALGQPDPDQLISLATLRWVHLTSAGYTRYDRADLKDAFEARGAILTNSSAVYAEPCAQHVLSMMFSLARQIPQCVEEQFGTRSWKSAEHRDRCRLLAGQSVLMLGFGAIAQQLAEFLKPLGMKITAVRRAEGKHGFVKIERAERVDDLLGSADHVVDLLPANPSTDGFMSAARFALMRPTAIFYNIGRGSTVNQPGLISALQSRKIKGAYLDVTEPEPLPREHPLWTAPNCYITPHTAGGHDTEFQRLVEHFLSNLKRFENGESLQDRVV
jgi:phosphoglycerate dehydrogenase-like enzyme